jgi:hypothetical protein
MVSRGALSGRRLLRPIRTDRHAVGRQVSQGAVGTVPRGPAEVEVAVEAFEGGDLDRLDLVQVAGDGLDGDPARLVIAIYARDFPHMGLGPTGSGLSDHRHEGAVVTAAVLDLEADAVLKSRVVFGDVSQVGQEPSFLTGRRIGARLPDALGDLLLQSRHGANTAHMVCTCASRVRRGERWSPGQFAIHSGKTDGPIAVLSCSVAAASTHINRLSSPRASSSSSAT